MTPRVAFVATLVVPGEAGHQSLGFGASLVRRVVSEVLRPGASQCCRQAPVMEYLHVPGLSGSVGETQITRFSAHSSMRHSQRRPRTTNDFGDARRDTSIAIRNVGRLARLDIGGTGSYADRLQREIVSVPALSPTRVRPVL